MKYEVRIKEDANTRLKELLEPLFLISVILYFMAIANAWSYQQGVVQRLLLPTIEYSKHVPIIGIIPQIYFLLLYTAYPWIIAGIVLTVVIGSILAILESLLEIEKYPSKVR